MKEKGHFFLIVRRFVSVFFLVHRCQQQHGNAPSVKLLIQMAIESPMGKQRGARPKRKAYKEKQLTTSIFLYQASHCFRLCSLCATFVSTETQQSIKQWRGIHSWNDIDPSHYQPTRFLPSSAGFLT